MTTATQDLSKIPDSQVTFGENKRMKDIRDLAETKFGDALIQVSVSRENKCFDVLVKNSVTEASANEFEQKWSMCKVQIFKPLPRKKK